MKTKNVSLRGEVVDFDLLLIREQISDAPTTETVQNRERFIELRRKRGTKRMVQEMLVNKEQQEAAALDVEEEEAAVPAASPKVGRKIVKQDQ